MKWLDKKDILSECYDRCMQELYKWSQPTADYITLKKQLETKELIEDPKHPIFTQHYLSSDNYKAIVNHFLYIYNLTDIWKDYCDIMINYLSKGGLTDKYIEGKDGFPGYRGYEKVLPISSKLSEEDTKYVIDTMNLCKNFYKLNRDRDKVSMSLALGASPTNNKKIVIDYWKSQGVILYIKDFNVEDIIYGEDNTEYDKIFNNGSDDRTTFERKSD